jgi:hypothetical protein
MHFLKRFFQSKATAEEPTFEIVERRISLDETREKIIIKVGGRELFANDFFRASLEDNDYFFGRFYLNNEDLWKTHFAPSREQAIAWFRGKSVPKDGYGTIIWGEKVMYHCRYCGNFKQFPLKISKVERVVVFTNLPHYREIVGWRVIEVDNEILGMGIPTKILEIHKTVPIIKWQSQKKRYVCQRCAARLADLGQDEKLAESVIFAPD